MEKRIREEELTDGFLCEAKKMGFSDTRLAELTGKPWQEISDLRHAADTVATFKMVDTCAAEFQAATPYYYSTYEDTCETNPTDRKKILILGAGPIRIGQGIESRLLTACSHCALGRRH